MGRVVPLQFLLAILLCIATPHVGSSPTLKTLRIAFPSAEDGFDPARISDSYSHSVTIHIFESLYAYDYLAIPAQIRPLTAAAMPEHSPDFRTWTIRIRPGIYFAPDPAFKGQRRELVAADYVYSFKRYADPAQKSPHWGEFEELGIKGLANLRKDALSRKQAFDYDKEIEGLRALDRYTLQFQLESVRPRLLQKLVGGFRGAVAREVVEAYGARIMEHPVGTGPFKLAQWRRASLIVLERNTDYREVLFDAQPAPNDVTGQAIATRLRGRRLPMVDRVEISIITENQPRWLTFVDGRIDTIDVPLRFRAPGPAGRKGRAIPRAARDPRPRRRLAGSALPVLQYGGSDRRRLLGGQGRVAPGDWAGNECRTQHSVGTRWTGRRCSVADSGAPKRL